MKTKALYIIFISLAILSVLLMAINKQWNYVINDLYISGIYIAMWFFLFLHTVGKTLEGKRIEINTYIPSILTFLAFLLNVIYVFCLKP